jgi:hypothetical protein
MAELTITVEREDEKEVFEADHYILLCFTAKDGELNRRLISNSGLVGHYIDAIRGCAEHLAKDESEFGAIMGQVVKGSIERTEKLIQEKLIGPEG